MYIILNVHVSFNAVSVCHLPTQPSYPLALFSAFPDCMIVSNPHFPTTSVLLLIIFLLLSVTNFWFSFLPRLPIETFAFRLAISPSDNSVYLWTFLSSITNSIRLYVLLATSVYIAPGEFIFPSSIDDTKRIKDILEEKPVSARYYLSDCYLETLKRHKARHEALGHGFGYEVRSLDDVAGAIVCGGMGRERNLIVDKRQTDLTPVTHIKGEINKEGIRKMTPREWARLQGFPNDFVLPLADVHLYKQFGNSVTVPVIKAIAQKIREILENGRIDSRKKTK